MSTDRGEAALVSATNYQDKIVRFLRDMIAIPAESGQEEALRKKAAKGEKNIYGVVPGGELACLDLTGKRRWDSGRERRFGLGPYLISQGLALTLDDQTGRLHLADIGPSGYRELATAKILNGHDAWGPMALAGGRLILRDYAEMVCLDVGGEEK